MLSELNGEDTFAAIVRQFGRPRSDAQLREDELVRERIAAFDESDPEPFSENEPKPSPMVDVSGCEEEYEPAPRDEYVWKAWEAFGRSPEGRELNRQRFEWNKRAHERAETIRGRVREELRASRRRPQRRPPKLPRPLPVLRVARPRERRPTRRRVVALRGSPRSRSDPDLADPPDLVGTLLALARATR
jgi:hypothetical protein